MVKSKAQPTQGEDAMRTSLSAQATRGVTAQLQKGHAAFARRYPGESGRRQPVHTVYGGAHLFRR
ncbi:MAG: hypothetical protein ACE5G6_04105, partial [Terriglobia bacterium]